MKRHLPNGRHGELMIYPHVIRLRKAWKQEPARAGSLLWQRKFNRPSGLDVREQVWLVIDPAKPLANGELRAISLNGHLLELPASREAGETSQERLQWNITPLLVDHNVVTLDLVSRDGVAPAILEEGVALEIRLAPVEDF